MSLSTHEACLDGAFPLLQAAVATHVLGPDGILAVYKRQLPATSSMLYPSLLIAMDTQGETVQEYQSDEDEYVYPLAVHIFDRRPADDGSKFWTWLAWRAGIKSVFRRVRFANVAGNWLIDTRPMTIPEAKRTAGPAYQDSRGGLMLLPRVVVPNAL